MLGNQENSTVQQLKKNILFKTLVLRKLYIICICICISVRLCLRLRFGRSGDLWLSWTRLCLCPWIYPVDCLILLSMCLRHLKKQRTSEFVWTVPNWKSLILFQLDPFPPTQSLSPLRGCLSHWNVTYVSRRCTHPELSQRYIEIHYKYCQHIFEPKYVEPNISIKLTTNIQTQVPWSHTYKLTSSVNAKSNYIKNE